MNSELEPIREQAAWSTKRFINHGDILSEELFVSTTGHDSYITRFLLSCGGPTAYVTVDEWQHVTYYNSWGCDDTTGESKTRIVLYDDLSAPWIEAAERLYGRYECGASR